jgi:hypothetical protein
MSGRREFSWTNSAMRRLKLILLAIALSACAAPLPRPVVEAPAPVVPAPVPADPADDLPPPAVSAPAPLLPAPVVRRQLRLEEFAEVNDEKLLQVYVGMSRQAVERIMDGAMSGATVNPFRRQSLAGADGRSYEVAFYLTRAPRAGRRVTETLLTPVIFHDERVVAIGRYPLKKLRRAACQARGKTC